MIRSLQFLWAVCLYVLLLTAPGSVSAQQCSSSGFGIPFGTVSTSNNTDVTALLPYQCQSNASVTYYKVCLFVPGGAGPIAGIDPKKMQDYNGHYINYNLYANAARTDIIGPPPTGAGYPLYTWDFSVPGGYGAPPRTVNVYGRVPSVPAGTAAGSYQAQLSGIALQYAWSNAGTPSDCFQTAGGGGGSAGVGFNGVTATVSNSCSIAISQASDLDFGTVSSLSAATDNASMVTLACPANTTWRVGVNDGLNAVVAGQRRMSGPGTDFVGYELYRDSGRTQRWGNDTAGASNTVNGSGAGQANPTVLTVYGRVPAQAASEAGAYSDTVTVTLTY